MKRKLIFIIPSSLVILSVVFFLIFFKSTVDTNDITIPQEEVAINAYIYIDDNNSLILKDKDSSIETVVEERVIDFKVADHYIVYIHKDSTGKHLAKYSLLDNSSSVIKDYYNNEFIINNDILYYAENNIIRRLDLITNEDEEVIDIGTEDFIFNYVDDSRLILSYIKNSVPTTQEYSFENNTLSLLTFDSTNIFALNGFIYGLNKESNIFRINSNKEIETISDFPVLKFYMNNNYLVYIDSEGKLMSLNLDGTNRVISDYANNFKIVDDYLYYMTPASKGKVFKTQLTGRHKETIIEKAHNDFNFDEINKKIK